jgi:hypothetical protein
MERYNSLRGYGAMTNKSFGWRLRNSLWILWTFTYIFNSIAFFWIGFRTGRKKWIIYGFIYLAGTLVCGMALGELGWISVFVWMASIIHAFVARNEYLTLRAAVSDAAALRKEAALKKPQQETETARKDNELKRSRKRELAWWEVICSLGVIMLVIFLPMAGLNIYELYTETIVDFHATPAEGLVGQTVAINLDVVYNQFAKIEIKSQKTRKSKSGTRTSTDITTRIYHAIKTSDGKVMALAIKPDLRNEVDIRWKNTLAPFQEGLGASDVGPLQLLGRIYEMDKRITPSGYKEVSVNPRTLPSKLFNDYVSGQNLGEGPARGGGWRLKEGTILGPQYRSIEQYLKNAEAARDATQDAELRLIEQDLKNAEVFPYVLDITHRNDSESAAKREKDRNFSIIMYIALSLLGAAMIIFPIALHRGGKPKEGPKFTPANKPPDYKAPDYKAPDYSAPDYSVNNLQHIYKPRENRARTIIGWIFLIAAAVLVIRALKIPEVESFIDAFFKWFPLRP